MVGKFLAVWLLLPLAPVLLLIGYLNRYLGISENLRLLIGLLLIFSTLFVTFLGWWGLRQKRQVVTGVTCLLAGGLLFGSSYATYINISVYRSLNQMIVDQQTMDFSLVVMADSDVQDSSDLEEQLIGRLDESHSNHGFIDEFLADSSLENRNGIIYFESPIAMIQHLYNGQLDAMIIASGFEALLEEREGFHDIAAATRVVEEFSMAVNQPTVTRPVGTLMNAPFSILLIGVDAIDSMGGLADALILATVNPQNLSVTLTSIPRDTFVHIPAQGFRDKIAHANNFGSHAVVEAVEGLFGMDIPFHLTVNMAAVVDLVDTLGGIDVNVPISFSEQNSRRQFGRHRIHVEAGQQILDGEQALALMRHRNSPGVGDLGRAAHQQLVLEGIVRQILSNGTNVSEFLALLHVLGQNIETNLSVGEMTSVLQFLIDQLPHFTSPNPMEYFHMMNMVLSGVDDLVQTGWAWFPLFMFFPFNGALADSYRLMSINLGNQEPEMATHFFFNSFESPSPRRWLAETYLENPRWEGIIVPGNRGLEEVEEYAPSW